MYRYGRKFHAYYYYFFCLCLACGIHVQHFSMLIGVPRRTGSVHNDKADDPVVYTYSDTPALNPSTVHSALNAKFNVQPHIVNKHSG